MNAGLTEFDLVKGFLDGYSEPYHASHSDYFGSYAVEVPMFQGRPDLVLGGTNSAHNDHVACNKFTQTVRKPKYSSVLGNMSFNRFVSGDFLGARLGIRTPEISRILNNLDEIGVVRSDLGRFILAPELKFYLRTLWAIEFKLKDWRRALYQAIRYRSSAQRVTVVMPRQTIPVRPEVSEVYSRYNVGLSSYDTESGTLKTLVRTKTMKPYSMSNFYYGLGHFMDISGCA